MVQTRTSVYTPTFIFFAKLSALCTKRTIIIDIQHVAQCRHPQKSYTPLCAHASALCEFTTKGERFYGIGRQKNLFIRQKFRSPYAVKPLSYNRNDLPWRVMLQVGVQNCFISAVRKSVNTQTDSSIKRKL